MHPSLLGKTLGRKNLDREKRMGWLIDLTINGHCRSKSWQVALLWEKLWHVLKICRK